MTFDLGSALLFDYENRALFHTPGKRYLLSLVAYVLWLISCACVLRADEWSDSITASDKAFFAQIRNAVLTDNIDWIASAIAYPIVARPGGHEITVRNKHDLKTRAKVILNEHLKSVLRIQSPDTLFKNWQGIMIGSGEIWFSEVIEKQQKQRGREFRLIALSLHTAPI